MFTQVVNGFRWLEIIGAFNVLFGIMAFISFVAFAIVFFWVLCYRHEEAQSCPRRKKDKDGDWEENDSLIAPGIGMFAALFLMSFSIFLGNGGLPTKEYIVMSAVAPRIDEYVKEHPDTLFDPGNLAGVVDNTAKSVLGLVSDSSNLIKGYLEKQLGNAVQSTTTTPAATTETK